MIGHAEELQVIEIEPQLGVLTLGEDVAGVQIFRGPTPKAALAVTVDDGGFGQHVEFMNGFLASADPAQWRAAFKLGLPFEEGHASSIAFFLSSLNSQWQNAVPPFTCPQLHFHSWWRVGGPHF
jgi:hypothetical protein